MPRYSCSKYGTNYADRLDFVLSSLINSLKDHGIDVSIDATGMAYAAWDKKTYSRITGHSSQADSIVVSAIKYVLNDMDAAREKIVTVTPL